MVFRHLQDVQNLHNDPVSNAPGDAVGGGVGWHDGDYWCLTALLASPERRNMERLDWRI